MRHLILIIALLLSSIITIFAQDRAKLIHVGVANQTFTKIDIDTAFTLMPELGTIAFEFASEGITHRFITNIAIPDESVNYFDASYHAGKIMFKKSPVQFPFYFGFGWFGQKLSEQRNSGILLSAGINARFFVLGKIAFTGGVQVNRHTVVLIDGKEIEEGAQVVDKYNSKLISLGMSIQLN